jgi:hypothetical protein
MIYQQWNKILRNLPSFSDPMSLVQFFLILVEIIFAGTALGFVAVPVAVLLYFFKYLKSKWNDPTKIPQAKDLDWESIKNEIKEEERQFEEGQNNPQAAKEEIEDALHGAL